VSAARIEVTTPKLFTLAGVFLIYAYGFMLFIPFLLAVLVISSLKFGFLTWLTLIALAVVTIFFLPFAQGNARVVKLVRTLNASAGKEEDCFIVQLTLSPRLRSGVHALLEDADDIGCLSLSGTNLVFRGDSINLSFPFEQIEEIQQHSVGLRRLYGSRIVLAVSGLSGVKSLEFAERSAWLLPTSRRTTRKLFESLSAKATRK